MAPGLLDMIAERVVIFDGGMGTMLIDAGLTRAEVPETWVFLRPSELRKIHGMYAEAGADVIQTNTFGANRIKLESSKAGSDLDPVQTNIKAAGLARQALEELGFEDRILAGDIGPTGRFFSPVGSLTGKDAMEAFEEQAGALAEGGVDLFLIETMWDIREAVWAVRAAKKAARIPVAVEMTFRETAIGFSTIMGDTPSAAVEALENEGADMIGANCTISSDQMAGLVREMRELTDLPLLFQPNAGQPVMEGPRPRYQKDPEEFAADIAEMVRAGADAVGGCCGTTPEFIRLIVDRIAR